MPPSRASLVLSPLILLPLFLCFIVLLPEYELLRRTGPLASPHAEHRFDGLLADIRQAIEGLVGHSNRGTDLQDRTEEEIESLVNVNPLQLIHLGDERPKKQNTKKLTSQKTAFKYGAESDDSEIGTVSNSNVRSSSNSSSVGSGMKRRRLASGFADDNDAELKDGEPGNRTAICLVGGARSFEATGPSILYFLIRQLEPNADLFINSPLDDAASKMWIFASAANVAAIRVYSNMDVDTSEHPASMLRSIGSPRGVQGLLQYFRVVEGCVRLIHNHEQKAGVTYSWIMRGRLDAFWSAPMPPLHTFQKDAYTIPYGSDWGGFNDRFGVGDRRSSRVALKRLSLLRDIRRWTNFSWLNSESAYKLQFQVRHVPVVRAHFPFCVLTHRYNPSSYTSPCNPFFFSLHSWLPLNGAKCMPCATCTSQNVEPAQKGFVFCNLTVNPWLGGEWEQRFDSAVGPYFARQREAVATASYHRCLKYFKKLQGKVVTWEAPKPDALCWRREMGPLTELGTGFGSYGVFLKFLTDSSVIISPNVIEHPASDSTWEQAMKVHVSGIKIERPKLSMTQLQEFDINMLAGWGFKRVDVLKLSPDGSGARALDAWLKRFPPSTVRINFPVCQLLISFPQRHGESLVGGLYGGRGDLLHRLAPRVLKILGMQLDSCVRGDAKALDRCTFYSLHHCSARKPSETL